MAVDSINEAVLSDKEKRERRYALIAPIGMAVWITLPMTGLVWYVVNVAHPQSIEAREELIDAGTDDGIEITNVNFRSRGIDTIDISLGSCALVDLQYRTEVVEGVLDITEYNLPVADYTNVSFKNIEELQNLAVVNICN